MNRVKSNDRIAYLLSFLAILIYKNGGTIVIEELSQFAGMDLQLSMDLDIKKNKVILTLKSN